MPRLVSRWCKASVTAFRFLRLAIPAEAAGKERERCWDALCGAGGQRTGQAETERTGLTRETGRVMAVR